MLSACAHIVLVELGVEWSRGSRGEVVVTSLLLFHSDPTALVGAALFLFPQLSGNASLARWRKNKAFIGVFLLPGCSADVLPQLCITSLCKAAAIGAHKSQSSHPVW